MWRVKLIVCSAVEKELVFYHQDNCRCNLKGGAEMMHDASRFHSRYVDSTKRLDMCNNKYRVGLYVYSLVKNSRLHSLQLFLVYISRFSVYINSDYAITPSGKKLSASNEHCVHFLLVRLISPVSRKFLIKGNLSTLRNI